MISTAGTEQRLPACSVMGQFPTLLATCGLPAAPLALPGMERLALSRLLCTLCTRADV
jgi:hypothetical protein